MKSHLARIHRNLANWLPVLLAPALASADMVDVQNFVNVFIFKGKLLEGIFSNDYAVFGLTVFFFTLMLYNIYVPLIGKIPVFAGDGKNAASKYGRIIAMCMSGLSSMAIFAYIFLFRPERDVKYVIRHTLGPFSTFAGVILSLLIFAIIYFGFKDFDSDDAWKKGIWGIGVFMIFFGTMMARPGWFMLGWFIVLIMLITLMVAMFKGKYSGGGSGGGGGGPGANDSITVEGLCHKLKSPWDPNSDLVPVDGIMMQADSSVPGKRVDAMAESDSNGRFVVQIKLTPPDKEIKLRAFVDKNADTLNFTPNRNSAGTGNNRGDTDEGFPANRSIFAPPNWLRLTPSANPYTSFSNHRTIRVVIKPRLIHGRLFNAADPAVPVSGKRVVALCFQGSDLKRINYSENTNADGRFVIPIRKADVSEQYDDVFLLCEDYLNGGGGRSKLDPGDLSGLKTWLGNLVSSYPGISGYFTPKAWVNKVQIENAQVFVELPMKFVPFINSTPTDLGHGNLNGRVRRTV